MSNALCDHYQLSRRGGTCPHCSDVFPGQGQPSHQQQASGLNAVGSCIRCGGWVGKQDSRGAAREDQRCTRDLDGPNRCPGKAKPSIYADAMNH